MDKKASGQPFPLTLLLVTYTGLIAFFILIYFSSQWMDFEIEKFTADPITTFDSHPFVGVVSNLGALIWCATASVLFFSYILLKNKLKGRSASFLLWSGLLTSLLLFDDLFMFHDYLALWHLNMEQYQVYLIYLILALTWFIKFFDEIISNDLLIFLLAGFFLGLSVVGDFILPQEGIAYMFEDAFKFFGIVTWAIYFIRASLYRYNKMNLAPS
ncbi:hypothetical protein [Gracilimonas amylolytica]|uniref:hypothetical protein n=1 Tax=Gracilimonas amylolytica TaxID=1749045 RepID=UPI000CD9A912|nr:hypothetical protein [Gracilimonas amylolytica]